MNNSWIAPYFPWNILKYFFPCIVEKRGVRVKFRISRCTKIRIKETAAYLSSRRATRLTAKPRDDITGFASGGKERENQDAMAGDRTAEGGGGKKKESISAQGRQCLAIEFKMLIQHIARRKKWVYNSFEKRKEEGRRESLPYVCTDKRLRRAMHALNKHIGLYIVTIAILSR